MITRIKIENFKSLKNVEIEFCNLMFLVGPNASGKSNFAQSLDFLSLVARESLEYAVADQGGYFNLCYRKKKRSKAGVRFNVSGTFPFHNNISCEFVYQFSFRADKEGIESDYYVNEEHFSLTAKHVVANGGMEQFKVALVRDQLDRNVCYKVVYDELYNKPEAYSPHMRDLYSAFDLIQQLCKQGGINPEPQGLIISGPLKSLPLFAVVAREFSGIRVFQLNPRIARQPSAASVRGDLGKHGENLASAISYMRRNNPEDLKVLVSWMQDVVPTIKGVFTNFTDTHQLGLFIEEKGFGSRWFADDVSDGTIMSIALFYALVDSRHTLVVIEEPENTLHPWILKRFLDKCRERGIGRQIVITTHSPLAVSAARPEEVFLAERGDGRSYIYKALDRQNNLNEIIRKDLIDLGQYWLDGGLGGVPGTPEFIEQDLFENTEDNNSNDDKNRGGR